MNAQLLLLSVGVGLTLFTLVAGLIVLANDRKSSGSRKRLKELVQDDPALDSDIAPVILRDMQLSSVPFLNVLLQRIPMVRRLDLLLAQGNLSIRLGSFLILMVTLALLGGIAAAHISGILAVAPLGALVCGSLPVFYATQQKRRRLLRFEKQFADAIDILTSALRAGLSFSAAIQVVAEESPDPVAREFNIVFEENRLGLDMRDALTNLSQRIDCPELRMFVTAVILQRETGGNLVEILENAAYVIRDRFRILGEVRAMTASQRFSGLILSLLPLGMAGLFLVMAPDYMKTLVTDPWGPYLIIAALSLQLVGYLAIRKIVAIKV
jgi:tight adherence protein B